MAWQSFTQHPVTQGIAIAAGSALVIYLVKMSRKVVWTPTKDMLSKFAHLVDDVQEIKEKVAENSGKVHSIDQLVNDVALIKSEVQANSGKSLKDQVTVLGKQNENISDQLVMMEARQRGIVSSMARATFEADSAFAWTEGNASIERLTGYGFAHLERRKWLSHVHDEDRNDVIREVTSALADGREVQVSFRFIYNGTGVVNNLRMVASPIFSKVKRDVILCWTGYLIREGEEESERRVNERRV